MILCICHSSLFFSTIPKITSGQCALTQIACVLSACLPVSYGSLVHFIVVLVGPLASAPSVGCIGSVSFPLGWLYYTSIASATLQITSDTAVTIVNAIALGNEVLCQYFAFSFWGGVIAAILSFYQDGKFTLGRVDSF